jgi:hypothetical protein
MTREPRSQVIRHDIRQRDKGPKHKTAATSARREDAHRGPQADPRVGIRKPSSRVCHQTAENECQYIVEEPTPSKTKEESADNLRVGAVGAPATFGSSVSTYRKNKWLHAYRFLELSSTKEGAM